MIQTGNYMAAADYYKTYTKSNNRDTARAAKDTVNKPECSDNRQKDICDRDSLADEAEGVFLNISEEGEKIQKAAAAQTEEIAGQQEAAEPEEMTESGEAGQHEVIELGEAAGQQEVTEMEEATEQQEAEVLSEEESTTQKGKITVNAGKLARMIAAAKTKTQLRSVMAKIRSDMREVKEGMKNGMCDQTELDKVNSLMSMAQSRMGEVKDRDATPAEESGFALASMM